MKPYQAIPIKECGEALMPIPLDRFAVVTPHPYAVLGAPYGRFSPYFLRQHVLQKLSEAQAHLQTQRPDWRLQIFDAYRPVPVQQFMVDHTFAQLAQAEGLNHAELTGEIRSRLQEKVLKFWASPSPDPATPPPHSTGGAVDLTLVNTAGEPIDMGSPIDEISARSYPEHFAGDSADPNAQHYHQHRQLLAAAMNRAGFRQHPNEWWHFSWGDQLWAWQAGEAAAQYGSAPIS